MKSSIEIAPLVFVALTAATPFSCPIIADEAVNVSLEVVDTEPGPITSASSAWSARTTDGSDNYMTIALTNKYGSPLSLSFASDAHGPSPVGNPLPTALSDNSFTRYTFPTGWAGNICLGRNLNINGSKIEGSYTGPPDIDISYVDGYSVPITCSSGNVAVSGCNIDLFKQANVSCSNQVDGPVCLNPARNATDGPASPFFAACKGAAYTYPNDNDANVSNLGSNLVSCCVGTSCAAPSRQPERANTSALIRMG